MQLVMHMQVQSGTMAMSVARAAQRVVAMQVEMAAQLAWAWTAVHRVVDGAAPRAGGCVPLRIRLSRPHSHRPPRRHAVGAYGVDGSAQFQLGTAPTRGRSRTPSQDAQLLCRAQAAASVCA